MAKRKAENVPENKGGRKSLFTPEARKAIIQAVRGGSSNADACNMAGISERTLYEWLQIGEAVTEGKDHRRMPNDQTSRDEFAQFAHEIKMASGQGNLARVSQIIRAGQDTWTHNMTGAVRLTPPPPVTWMDVSTGQLIFDNPDDGIYPSQWERQWSGEVWRRERGAWQALAWHAERSDPDNWGRRTTVRIEGGIDITTVNATIQALIMLGQDPNEFFAKLQQRAGLSPPADTSSDG